MAQHPSESPAPRDRGPSASGPGRGVVLAVGAVGLLAGMGMVVSVVLPRLLPPGGAGEPISPFLSPENQARLRELVIPDFSLTAQDGRAVTRADLEGRWTVLAFQFTHCPLACPVMSGQMLRLTETLKDTDARFLSVSVDPERDTPQRLTEYLGRLGADTRRWTFCTGDRAVIRALAVDALKFALDEDPKVEIELPEGGTMRNIVHPPHFILIGPDVRVAALYKGTDEKEVDQLAADLRVLMSARR
ncbi:MAG: SCO family protein [Phycisphaerales bacterium]|nr:SCO family protein [Phycisphaerales bacterium]